LGGKGGWRVLRLKNAASWRRAEFGGGRVGNKWGLQRVKRVLGKSCREREERLNTILTEATMETVKRRGRKGKKRKSGSAGPEGKLVGAGKGERAIGNAGSSLSLEKLK